MGNFQIGVSQIFEICKQYSNPYVFIYFIKNP